MPDSHSSDFLRPAHVSLDEHSGAILARIHPPDYGYQPRPVRLGDTVFAPKDELHITLCSAGAAAVLARWIGGSSGRAGAVRTAIAQADLRFTKQPGLVHIVKAAGVESLIQLVDLPGLPALYDSLSALAGQRLVLPPAHVTLYVLGSPRGIGLPTPADLERMNRGQYSFEALEDA